MLTPDTYQVYLVRYLDWYVRYVFQGDNTDEQRRFLAAFNENVEFLGQLPLPMKSDIDVEGGIGTRKVGRSVLISCTHAKQLITIDEQPTTFLVSQRKLINNLRHRQEEFLRSISENS